MKKIILRPKNPKHERPKTTSRLPQLSKSNHLMRRFYEGRKPTPQSTKLNRVAYDQDF